MIYFTSDLHFGHSNIIKYCLRPFTSRNQMDSTLIYNWNETVGNDDIVYILGDFTMKGADKRGQIEKIVRKLNGTKHLILGNHDTLKPLAYLEIGFKSVHTSLDLWIPEYEERYLLTHDPVHSITMPDEIWLVGHVHQMFSELGNAINVGVDVRDFKPISFMEVQSIADKMK